MIVTLGMVLGQAGGDYLYYYSSYVMDNSVKKDRTPFSGWSPFFVGSILKSKDAFYAGILCFGLGFIIAIYLTMKVGYIVLILACIGGLIGFLFTSLMNKGLEEPAIFLAFGFLPVIGVYYVMTKSITVEPIVASISVGFLVTVVAYVKGASYTINKRGESCLVVRTGKVKAPIFFLAAYLSIIIGVVSGCMPAWTLISLATIPLALNVTKVFNRKYSQISEYMSAVIKTLALHSITGILITIGYLIPF